MCKASSLYQRKPWWTSLVVQWLRTCLPMQGTWVQSLAQKILLDIGQRGPCALTTEPTL